MIVYYNDNDPRAAAWLRELIADGLIPPGDVDERGIADVTADDVRGYTQVHLFAGIGGWPYALWLAGWPDDQPVWTGSCPCQPFSCAGKREGEKDPRHLWPEFRRLIAECRPPVVFGEQVASTIGRLWLAGVRSDLEALGYAVGAADLCAAGVGAPHIRQRLYWVADRDATGLEGAIPESHQKRIGFEQHRADGRLADAGDAGPRPRPGNQGVEKPARLGWGESNHGGVDGGMGDANRPGLPTPEFEALRGAPGNTARGAAGESGGSFWADSIWLSCADGKARRCPESVLLGLAHGLPDGLDLGGAESGFPLCAKVPGRAMFLRGYGNAIVPQLAAEFIQAYIELRCRV